VLTSVQSPTRLGSRVDAGLVRIHPHTNRVSATTPLANLNSQTHQAQLAVGAGSAWVEGQHLQDGLARAVIDRVDPSNGGLRGTIETGDLSPAALAAGFGAVWLRPAAGALLRLDPAAV
jgi:glutamine cyclotransferase